MQTKFLTAALLLLGTALPGTLVAQQTSGATTKPSSSAKTAPAAKAQPAAPAQTAQPLALTTQKDKISYAIGTNLGQGLKHDGVEIDPDILVRALKDALAGQPSLMSEDQVKQIFTELRAEVGARKQAEAEQLAKANKEAGEQFLAANKTKEGVVTLPSGLQYKILTGGIGPKPTSTDRVVCNYRGTLIDGTEFDSSYKTGQPATFGVSQVIKGWTEALQLMPVGSKWQLFIPPDLAYGERSPGPEIPPDSTLIFEIELLSIEGQGK